MPNYTKNKSLPEECVKIAEQFLDINKKMDSPGFYNIKAHVAISLFYWHLEESPKDRDPVPEFIKNFKKAILILKTVFENSICSKDFFSTTNLETEKGTGQVVDEDFEKKISGLFSDVWVGFSDKVYFEEALSFTRERFKRNNVNADDYFKNKVVVDAGCGSGKYSATLASLGAKKVIGIDIGEKGLEFANKQKQKHPRGNIIEYKNCSLIDIKLDDSSVDMVWSNGVIHHTKDYEKCLSEFARIIKPDGNLYLYVEGEEGLYELLCDTLVKAHRGLPRSIVQNMLTSYGTDSGRIYWVMDNLFAPYERKTRCEVEKLLHKHGFEDIFPMLRGLDIDNNEMVYSKQPYAKIKHGDGMLKYLATLRK